MVEIKEGSRVDTINKIFQAIGIKRANPAKQYMTKREINSLYGWICGRRRKSETGDINESK